MQAARNLPARKAFTPRKSEKWEINAQDDVKIVDPFQTRESGKSSPAEQKMPRSMPRLKTGQKVKLSLLFEAETYRLNLK